MRSGMIPIHLDTDATRTLQDQLYDKLRGAILTGSLQPGTSLPSSRLLASELKVSRNTVTLAFERLINEGYLKTKIGSGTYVSDPVPESCVAIQAHDKAGQTGGRHANRPSMVRHPSIRMKMDSLRMIQDGPNRTRIDFWYGNANARNFPAREWRQLLVENVSRIAKNISGYGAPEGAPELREAIARHVSANRAIPTHPDQVIITAGAQEGLNLISRLFVEPSARIVVEDPCYKGAALVFKSYGGTLLPIPVDGNGMCTHLLAGCGASLAYVTPSHQFPTGATMNAARRIELLRWAETTGAYIIEDDYDSDFRYDGPPLPALAGLEQNTSVLYLGTFSKSIGAGIRTGFLVVPRQLIEPMREAKSLANYGHPWIEQILLADFIGQGRFTRHLRRIRHAYGLARATLVNGLADTFGPMQVVGAEAGMHIMWTLPEHFPSVDQTVAIGESVGVGLYTLAAIGAHEIAPSRYPRALFLGYGSLAPESISKGLARLARGLRSAGFEPKPARTNGIPRRQGAVREAERDREHI
jgi:GntR family transcriptional regulator/MocR family aminotransferase